MYTVSDIATPQEFMDKMKRTLSHRPVGCMGIRLLMNLHDGSNFILVSYWPDERSMFSGTPFLHEQIVSATKDTRARIRIANYEIKHEV